MDASTNATAEGRRSWTLAGAADLFLKLAAAVGVLSAGFLWLVEPRIRPFTDVLGTVAAITTTLDQITDQMEAVIARVERLEVRGSMDETPPLVFAKSGSAIGDGEAGDTVVMRWSYDKSRECGAPLVDAFMEVPVRGATMPVTLRFRNVGIATTNGRSIILPLGPGVFAFPVTIPANVPTGEAEGWVVHTYPDCPMARPVRSPRVPFRILARMLIPSRGELWPEPEEPVVGRG